MVCGLYFVILVYIKYKIGKIRLAGDHLYGKWLFAWLLLVMSLMVFNFVPSFFPWNVFDEIWDLVESVTKNFPTYFKMR